MTAPVLFPLAIALLAVAYGIAALGFPWMGLQEGFGPGLFPGLIAALVAILAGIECLVQFAAHRRRHSGPDGAGGPMRPLKLDDAVNAAIVAVAVIATVLAIPLVGFVPAGAAAVFVLCVLMGARPVWKALLIGIATSGAIYLIFSKGFNVLFAF